MAGGFGVGKTTFVGTLSDIAPLTTAAAMTTAGRGIDNRGEVATKTTTTVAMDFGRTAIDGGLVSTCLARRARTVLILWDDLNTGALGAVVLVDSRRLEDSLPALDYLESRSIPFVIPVNLFEGKLFHTLSDLRCALNVDDSIRIVVRSTAPCWNYLTCLTARRSQRPHRRIGVVPNPKLQSLCNHVAVRFETRTVGLRKQRMMKQIAGVGKYTVIRWMYTGPISSVFEISDEDGSLLVLKALNRQHRFSSDLRGEFIDEASRLRGLDHPALIDGLDYGLAEHDLPYFVMERADESLYDTLLRGQLSTSSALHVVAQIGDALDYLHEKSLVHRDVKPRNVFMFRNGNTEVVKLGDLGLVRNFHYTLTVAGTASYAAVETLEGRPVAEMFRSRADIYSLSVIATQLLSGELPPLHFRNGGPWFTRMPDSVAEVLLRGMQNEPSERFGSGKEFVNALAAAVEYEPLAGGGHE